MDEGLNKTTPLCKYCSAIFPILETRERTRINHCGTLGDLVHHARETSCGLCASIQRHWPAKVMKERFCDDTEDEFNETQLEFYTSGATMPNLSSSEEDQDPHVNSITLTGELHAKKHKFYYEVHLVIATCILDLATMPKIWTASAQTTSVPEKHEVVKSWLSRCEEAHGVCSNVMPLSREALPERLVKIALNSETNELEVCLVVSAQETPLPMRYAALSHCWGKHMPLKTVRENVETHAKNIPMSSSSGDTAMPRSFREAVELSYSLGLGYLWIDSLCIVQDDAKEWGSEAARMKDVYSNATITIAASYGVDCQDGCFVDDGSKPQLARYLHKVDRFKIELPKTDPSSSGSSTLAVRIYNNELGRRSKETVLSRRGWTLQEQVLSRRVLHCTYPEIHWQCCSTYCTEAGVVLARGDPSQQTHVKTMQELQNELSSTTATLRDHGLQAAWLKWMENYSEREFSFINDQTAALAGLVQEYHDLTGFTHILACWEETMCRDLAWQIGDRLADPEEPLPGMPSWSWLSRNREVLLDFWIMMSNDTLPAEAKVLNHAKLLEKKIVWEDTPLLSELRCAELMLEAPIKKFRISTSPETYGSNPPYVSFDDDIRHKTPEDPLPWYGVAKLDGFAGATETQYCNGVYTCMLLRSCKYRPETQPKYNRETFLILEQVGEDGDGSVESPLCYRRLGLGGIHTRDREDTDTNFGDAVEKVIRLI